MKFVSLALLVVVLLVCLANLAGTLGIVGNSAYEYRALPSQQMDDIGFRKIAEANGIDVGEDDKIKFPPEMRNKLLKFNMLPYTISEIEKEGWRFVSVTSDNHYIFRKRK